MKEKFKQIWQLSLPYLEKGVMKDFVIHTKGVVRAMKLLLKQEDGDENILIPAAILHDAGWYKVPPELQKSDNKEDNILAMKLHLKFAPPVIRKILTEVEFSSIQIKKVIDAVVAHKFQKPRALGKRLLIDADNLADAFKEQFYKDVEVYNVTPERNYEHRKSNWFYTKTARIIFNRELKKRRKEFLNN